MSVLARLPGGHLVALREGDLAFLLVYPADEAGSSEVGFGATFPTREVR